MTVCVCWRECECLDYILPQLRLTAGPCLCCRVCVCASLSVCVCIAMAVVQTSSSPYSSQGSVKTLSSAAEV